MTYNMTYKKVLSLLLCALMLLCLAACAGEDAPSGSAAPGGEGDGGASAAPAHEAQPTVSASGELRMADGGYACQNENGRYEMTQVYSGSTNILYTDFATAQEIVLCNRPECLHNDDSCTGWRENITYLGLVDDKLLLASGGYYRPDETRVPSTLELCDLNGANSKALVTFDADIFTGPVVFDDEYLYFMLSKEDVDAGHYIYLLYRMSREGGEPEEVHSFGTNYDFIGGVADGKLIMERWIQQEYTAEDEAAMEAGTFEYIQERMVYSLGLNGAEEELARWTDLQRMSSVFKNGVRYYDENGRLHAHNLLTGEERDICEMPKGDTDDNAFINHDVWNGKITIDVPMMDDALGYGVLHRWAADIDTGELAECKLTMTSERISDPLQPMAGVAGGGATARHLSYGGSPDPVHIYAETADAFLVMPRVDFSTQKLRGMEDDWYDIDVEIRRYALIPKADFWAGEANYTYIDMTARYELLVRDLAAETNM